MFFRALDSCLYGLFFLLYVPSKRLILCQTGLVAFFFPFFSKDKKEEDRIFSGKLQKKMKL